ncbi:MAG: hypothetical protein ABIK89_11470 [Planctomycetota bacterium]
MDEQWWRLYQRIGRWLLAVLAVLLAVVAWGVGWLMSWWWCNG